MTDLFLWPRLAQAPANEVLTKIAELDARELRASSTLHHPDAAPVEVGGHRVDDTVLEELCTRVRRCADDSGFPSPLNKAAGGTFDRPATRIVHETMKIVPSDAAAPGVWNYVTLVLLPDIAVWRWPTRTPNRLLGHPRNTFRRLWWRAEVVGADCIDAPEGLGEDELVNIMERPTIAADVRLARVLARKIVATDTSGLARSEIMRDAAKRILRAQAAICPEALSDAATNDLVDELVGEAVTALLARSEARNASEGFASVINH